MASARKLGKGLNLFKNLSISKMEAPKPETDVEFVPITGSEFKSFIKGHGDAVEIVCPACLTHYKYIGQHNYKNINYYVLEAVGCTCKPPFITIPYIKNNHYAIDPAFMRKDHETERVVGAVIDTFGNKANIHVMKMVFKHSPEPVYRFVERNGHIESVELTGTELLQYYKKEDLQRKTRKFEPLVWENVVKSG